MYWYIVHVKAGRQELLIKFFALQANIKAFVPKIEVWHSSFGFIVQELFSNLVFIKTNQNKEMIDQHYKAFFKSIDGFDKMLDFDHIDALNTPNQELMEKLFGNHDIVIHSVGDKYLHIIDGPLKGLEKRINSVNVEKRQAILDFMIEDKALVVPLEITCFDLS